MIVIQYKEKIAAAYIRVSTDDQLELSPHSQKEKILEYAKANSITVPEKYIYIEGENKKGLSGRHAANRPKFQEMIATAKITPKPFDCILLWKFSRFARNIDEATYYKSVLRNKCKIDVISVSEPISEGMYGRLVEMIIEWSDEFYSYNLSGEVKRGMCAKAKAGEFSSHAPFGYEMKDKKLFKNKETAPIVERIYKEYASGKPVGEISASLIENGVKTKFGNPPDNRFVTYIVTNPIYKGYIAFSTDGRRKKGELNSDKIIYERGIHQPIVEESLWQKCFERYHLSKNKRRKCKNEYALRALMYCSDCLSPLTYSGCGSLQCSKYNRGECRASHRLNLELSESEIFKKLNEDLGSEIICEIMKFSPSRQNHILMQIIEKITVSKTDSRYEFEINYR